MKRGFTLIEVIISILLFNILFLGLFNAIFLGMEMQTVVRQRIFAQDLLTQTSEVLRNLPLDNPDMIDDGDQGDLDNYEEPDFGDSVTYHDIPFFLCYNIAVDVPEDNMRTIRLFVMRNNIRISTDIVRWEEE